jgi:adenosylcobinamide-phosphate synthase
MKRSAAGPARAVGLAAGTLLDVLLADPQRGHPVAAFGRAAAAVETRVRRDSVPVGAAFAAGCVAVPVLLGAAAERSTADRPAARAALTAAATWVVLGGASLAREGIAMDRLLSADDLFAARRRLGNLCARDAGAADRAELARATVESVAENTSDAVVAPLCWGALAGIPGLLGYRAVNTLDAMIGYRSPTYLRFGRAAARADDVANLVPARLTGLCTVVAAPLVGGRCADALRALRSGRRAHPSPNAGWCEASAAGALGVALGGANSYGGTVEHRPVLNPDGRAPQPADLARAVRLSRAVRGAAVVLLVGALWVRR